MTDRKKQNMIDVCKEQSVMDKKEKNISKTYSQYQKIIKINNNRKQMHRPPRSVIKSSSVFTCNNAKNRKVFTPDCIAKQLQPVEDAQIKSMRDTLAPSDLHQSMNQTDNIQYLQISKNNHTSAYNITTNINPSNPNTVNLITGRSFKIRNVGSGKTISINNAIKQNGFPAKLAYKPLASSVKASTISLSLAHKKKNLALQKQQQQNIQSYKLYSYPQHFHLTQLSNKIGYHKMSNQSNCCKQFEQKQWAMIISQSLFYGSLLEEVNLLKLKNLVENLIKIYGKMKIVLRLHSERQLQQIKQKITQRKYPISFIIWGKYKYFETINIFDITEIALLCQTNRYIIVEDNHQVIKSVYFQYTFPIDDKENNQFNDYSDCKEISLYKKITQSLLLHSKDNNSAKNNNNNHIVSKKIDLNCKYLYLKFNGIPQLMKFTHKLKINSEQDVIQSQKIQNCDETQNLFILEELRQKIKLGNIRKMIKNKLIQQKNSFKDGIKQDQKAKSKQNDKDKSKDKIKDKQIRKSRENSSKQIYNDRNQEMKKKILQNIKVPQDDSQTQMRKNSIKLSKNQPRPRSSDQKMGNSKNQEKNGAKIQKRPDTPIQVNEKASIPWPNCKSSHQLVSQLLKNNTKIQRQIWRFQEKTLCLNLMELYAHKVQA